MNLKPFPTNARVASILGTALVLLAGCSAAPDEAFDATEDPQNVEEAIEGCPEGGIRVWEHVDFEGRSAVFCEGWYPNLGDVRTNLNFWESWNDRISSFTTFGFGAQDKLCAFEDSHYRAWEYRYPHAEWLDGGWKDPDNEEPFWENSLWSYGQNDVWSALKIGPEELCGPGE